MEIWINVVNFGICIGVGIYLSCPMRNLCLNQRNIIGPTNAIHLTSMRTHAY